MKKTFLSLFSASLLAVPFLGLAQSIMPVRNSAVGNGLAVNLTSQPITTVLGTVANYVVGLLVIFAVFWVLKAAYGFMTSDGDSEKVGVARSQIMYAGIGIVIALLAKGIVELVLSAIPQ